MRNVQIRINTYPFSSLSPQEEYALTGTLTPSAIEKLLELRSNVDKLDVIEEIREAFAMQEACLDTIAYAISDLGIIDGGRNIPGLDNVRKNLEDFKSSTQMGVDTAQHTLEDTLRTLRKLYDA